MSSSEGSFSEIDQIRAKLRDFVPKKDEAFLAAYPGIGESNSTRRMLFEVIIRVGRFNY